MDFQVNNFTITVMKKERWFQLFLIEREINLVRILILILIEERDKNTQLSVHINVMKGFIKNNSLVATKIVLFIKS